MYGFGKAWFGPVVADAVGQAVCPQQALFAAVAVVVLLPVNRVFAHDGVGFANQVGVGFQAEFDGNLAQAEEGLAVGKGQCRTDFEDGEVVAHEVFEGFRGLVVGRVRFKDGVREFVSDVG